MKATADRVGLVGIELTRDGTLTFDQEKFTNALESDPATMTELFTDRTGGTGRAGICRKQY